MKRLAVVLLLAGCTKHVPVEPPISAFRITRLRDGAVLVVQYKGTHTLEQLKDEFCENTTCMVEVVQLRHDKERPN